MRLFFLFFLSFSLFIPLCWHVQSVMRTTHTIGLIIISEPRLRPSFDLNHLSSLWALHLIEPGPGNHCAFRQTCWCNSAAWIITAVIYSGIMSISVPMLLDHNFPCFFHCALKFLCSYVPPLFWYFQTNLRERIKTGLGLDCLAIKPFRQNSLRYLKWKD